VWPTYTGRGVKVGVYDEGVQASHFDLKDNYDSSLQFVFNGVTQDPTKVINTGENGADKPHGTAVAGIIASEANDVGTVGIAYNAHITGILANGTPEVNSLQYAFEMMAWAKNFDVTNHSWGFRDPMGWIGHQPVENGVTWANNIQAGMEVAAAQGRQGLGTVFVASADNNRVATIRADHLWHAAGDANLDSPVAISRYSLVVGNLDTDGSIAFDSDPGANLLVVAPGTDIPTTDLTGQDGYEHVDNTEGTSSSPSSGGNYCIFGGTSAAAPVVTGVVALMMEANPNLGWRDVEAILSLSARHVGSAIDEIPQGHEFHSWRYNGATDWNGGGRHFSEDYGYGEVDALAAVRLAETWSTQNTSKNEMHLQPKAVAIFDDWLPDGGLPDGSSSAPHYTFSESDQMKVETITATIGLSHKSLADLHIWMVSPNGTSVDLLRPGTGAGANAVTPLNEGWQFSTTAFMGESGAGAWNLYVQDVNNNGLIGKFSNAVIDLYGAPTTTNDTYFYTNEFSVAADNPYPELGHLHGFVYTDLNGGTDTINASAVTTDTTIDFEQGHYIIAGTEGFFPVYADPNVMIENVITGDGNDTIVGNAADNWLRGMRGNDTLHGGEGNDRLEGGLGVDNVYGDGGEDTLVGTYEYNLAREIMDGGDGNDTVDFSSVYKDTFVDLSRNYSAVLESEGWHDFANLVSIENVICGSGKNILIGDAGANSLTGGGDDDILDGGAGNDTLTGFTGTNTFRFDDDWGHDEIKDFIHTKLLQGSGSPSRLGDGTGHDLIDMTNVTGLHSMSQLTIIDTQAGAVIEFGTNSILLDGVKADSLTASDFSFAPPPLGQTFDATAFWGGTLTGTPGAGDTASFASSSAGIYVDLATELAETDDVSKTEHLTSIENVTGSLTAVNTLMGDENDNILAGGNNFNWFHGGGGNNTLIGGDGIDLADYFGTNGSVTIDLSAGKVYHGNYVDMVTSIEQFRGTTFGDTFTGDAADNYFLGEGGNNKIYGGAGKDWLEVYSGNNIMDGGSSNDKLVAGTGNDVLTGGSDADTFVFGAHGAGHTEITDFNAAKGDRIDFSQDALVKQMSDVTIADDGHGNAMLSYSDADGTGTVVLDHVDPTAVTAADFLHFGPPPLGQTFDATAFWGGTLTGTPGAGDTASFASSSAGIYVDLATELAETDDVSKTEQLTSIENVTGSLTAMNTLHGDQNDNILIGGNNFNWFDGRDGNNALIGGSGIDLADYFGTNGPVTIDLPDGKVYHGNYVDTVTSIEQFRGTTFGDTFTGDAADNYFLGEGGNNKISGGAGNDWLEVYSGNNIMDGGSSNDKLVAGTGNDVLTGGSDADTFVFGAHGAGYTEITDFNAAEGDRIDFSQDALVKQISDVTIADDGHGNAMLSYSVSGATGTVLLDHIASAAVNQNMFVF
jgi:Ca2+-binding RTX toxin-like protein